MTEYCRKTNCQTKSPQGNAVSG